MRNFFATTIVIVAVIGLIFANNYSNGAPEKEYERLYRSEANQTVSSKEGNVMKQKICESLKSEDYDVEDFFIRVRNLNESEISVVVLLKSNQIKVFELKSNYSDIIYSLLLTGTPKISLVNEAEEFIESCNFKIQNNEIVMISANKL